MDLKEKAKQLPSSPGVYLMKDSQGSILYVGKSKNLKNRVQSYFQNSKNHSNKVEKLVNHLKDFDYILTDTEFEAFMLECELIKKYQPLYNKLMKNTQSYKYISIDQDHRIELISRIKYDGKSSFFGPFTSKNSVENAILGLKEFYKIDCNDFSGHHAPCLNYSLGKCIGMCFDRSAKDQFHKIIDRFIHLLEGTDTGILEEMNQAMGRAAENFDYETAAKIRDNLESIKSLIKKEEVIKFTKENKNIVIMEPVSGGMMKLFLVKGNKVLFNKMVKIDEKLLAWMKSTILAVFEMNNKPKSNGINKENIDEALIVYRYLNSDSCKSIIIPEKWLQPENQSAIEIELKKLVGMNQQLRQK